MLKIEYYNYPYGLIKVKQFMTYLLAMKLAMRYIPQLMGGMILKKKFQRGKTPWAGVWGVLQIQLSPLFLGGCGSATLPGVFFINLLAQGQLKPIVAGRRKD